MSTINITNARKDLYNLVEAVNMYHEPALIVGKRANAVLISEDDWSAIQETLYLDSIPGMTKSILEGANEALEDCISEEMVKW
ncbi:MAG: type II toxin-antitoxin system Phd/YefM family antitoxin [Lachnospiraceae bacterium]|nr:type II toxin-antitoxin system Phd/YefM family antitoxin [Lachnospiraceae bacterium]